jgi:imidazole glycerol phosphate synthase glutamine amidotransferase subunit
MPDRSAAKVALAATGVANLASIMAAFRRAGTEPYIAPGPDELAAAAFAVLPGVGSFGSAMSALAAAGMDEAFRDRVKRGAPTMGVCAGMQLFFEGSDESPGVAGMGIVPGVFRRFPAELPVPQLGWNRVKPCSAENAALGNTVRQGWAYFANSYRLSEAPEGFSMSLSEYGESFVAALERPSLLLCQFHPELSGPWGLELIEAWLGPAAAPAGGAS